MTFPAGGYADLATAVADGLQHYWPFDETAGYVVNDLVGTRHLSITRAPDVDSIVAAPFGNARSTYAAYGFDTVPLNTQISAASVAGGTSYTNWTAAFRFYPQNEPTDTSNGTKVLFQWNTTNGFYVAFIRAAGPTYTFRVSNLRGTTILSGVDVPAFEQWHTVAVTTDTGANETKFYLNGVLVGTHVGVYTLNTNTAITFASNTVLSSRARVDDLCFWDRPLSAAELLDFHTGPTMPNQGVVGTPLVNEFEYLRTYTTINVTSTCIAYGDGRWIIGVYAGGGTPLYVWTSNDDGATWVDRQVTAVTYERITALAYGGSGLWVGSMNSGRIAVSVNNGDTWTIRERAATGWGVTTQIDGVAYGNGVWVFTGYGGRVAWMTDPVAGTMTMLDTSFFGTTTYMREPMYHAGVWLVCSRANGFWRSTDDAQSFVAIKDDLPVDGATNSEQWGLAYTGVETVVAGGRVVAAVWTGTAWRSQDAVTWVMDTDFDGVSLSFESFQKPASGGYNQALVSSNNHQFIGGFGDWVKYRFAATNTFYDSDFGNGRFLVLAGTRQVYSAEVTLLENTQEATINVEVDFERPVIAAATMPQAAIDVAINVIAGTLREVDIAATVDIVADGYAWSGYQNLLEGLVAFWPFDLLASGGQATNVVTVNFSSLSLNFTGNQSNLPDQENELVGALDGSVAGFNSSIYCIPASYYDPQFFPTCRDRWTRFDGEGVGLHALGEDAFTLSFWTYSVQKVAGGLESGESLRQPLFHSSAGRTTSFNNMLLEFIDDGLGDKKLRFSVIGDSFTDDFTIDSGLFDPYDRWVNYQIKRRKDRLYVLANLEVIFDTVAPAGALSQPAESWRFGGELSFGLKGSSYWGWIDEAGYWSRELSEAESSRIYNDGRGLIYPFMTSAAIQLGVGVDVGQRTLVDYRRFLPDRQAHHFVGVITGAEDALDDLVVPISYWQATRQVPEQSSYLQMVIPATTEAMAGLAERPNGRMIIRSRYRTGDYTWEEDFVWAPAQEIGFTRSLSGQTLQIQGRQLVPAPAFPITWLVADDEVMRFDVQSEKRRVRLNLNLWMRPGESVTVFGETFVIGWINLYANNSGAFMDVGEVGG